jgi:hypothetical protein
MRFNLVVDSVEICTHVCIAACYAMPALGHSPVAALYLALAVCRLVMLVARYRVGK